MSGSPHHGIVNVDSNRLDRLLSLVGELVITGVTLTDQGRRARGRHGFTDQVLHFIETTEQVERLGEEIRAKIIEARLVPIDGIFSRFKGLLKEFTNATDTKGNKDVVLKLVGEHTKVDKRTIDQLAEPLVHLVRNALDHGIESTGQRKKAKKPPQATMTLEARHEGNRLIVEVKDDGAGVDLERVKSRAIASGLVTPKEASQLTQQQVIDILFKPGFSTNTEVTQMSGRGVGMDAARHRVEALGGVLSISTVRGEGSCARIDLPLTTAIVKALKIGLGDETYAIPVEYVREIVQTSQDALATVEGYLVFDLRGKAIPLVALAKLLAAPAVTHEPAAIRIVVVHCCGHKFGLIVDRVLERQDIVIQSLGKRLTGTAGLAGASIGGDGKVVMVLDVAALCLDAQKDETAAQGQG